MPNQELFTPNELQLALYKELEGGSLPNHRGHTQENLPALYAQTRAWLTQPEVRSRLIDFANLGTNLVQYEEYDELTVLGAWMSDIDQLQPKTKEWLGTSVIQSLMGPRKMQASEWLDNMRKLETLRDNLT